MMDIGLEKVNTLAKRNRFWKSSHNEMTGLQCLNTIAWERDSHNKLWSSPIYWVLQLACIESSQIVLDHYFMIFHVFENNMMNLKQSQ